MYNLLHWKLSKKGNIFSPFLSWQWFRKMTLLFDWQITVRFYQHCLFHSPFLSISHKLYPFIGLYKLDLGGPKVEQAGPFQKCGRPRERVLSLTIMHNRWAVQSVVRKRGLPDCLVQSALCLKTSGVLWGPWQLSWMPHPPVNHAGERGEKLHHCVLCMSWHTKWNHTGSLRCSQQLFICYNNGAHGKLLPKQRVAHWLCARISIFWGRLAWILPQYFKGTPYCLGHHGGGYHYGRSWSLPWPDYSTCWMFLDPFPGRSWVPAKHMVRVAQQLIKRQTLIADLQRDINSPILHNLKPNSCLPHPWGHKCLDGSVWDTFCHVQVHADTPLLWLHTIFFFDFFFLFS